MEQLIALTEIVTMFDSDVVIEIYTKGDTEPWFANKAYLLQSIAEEYHTLIDRDALHISSKFAGYEKSHIVFTFDKELPLIEQKKDWWDRLRLAKPEEIVEIVEDVIRGTLFTKIRESHNEIAVAALESGQCDSAIQEAISKIDYSAIEIGGFTKLDIINTKSNPSDSVIRKTIQKAIQTSLNGEDGKAFQDILFG